jgi:plastocyanin
MSNQTLFYVFGICLVLGAVLITTTGIRRSDFPPRALLIGVTALFAGLVLATAAFAVLNAKDEQDKRNAELAAQEATAASAEGASGQQGAGKVLEVTSPADGGLKFIPNGLTVKAGTVTLSYDNPSSVEHSIAIASEGKQLGATSTVRQGTVKLTENLVPGQYVFYCTVPGHRQAGMQGTLTVTGSAKP